MGLILALIELFIIGVIVLVILDDSVKRGNEKWIEKYKKEQKKR